MLRSTCLLLCEVHACIACAAGPFQMCLWVLQYKELKVGVCVLRSAWLSGSSDGEGEVDARVPSPPGSSTGAGSLLDTVVLAQWEDRTELGLFRYDVTACPTKACAVLLLLFRTPAAGPFFSRGERHIISGVCAAETARGTHTQAPSCLMCPVYGYLLPVASHGTLRVSKKGLMCLCNKSFRGAQLKAVSACVQVVPGAFGFIAQFNEGRGSKKRQTEFCVDQVRRCTSSVEQLRSTW